VGPIDHFAWCKPLGQNGQSGQQGPGQQAGALTAGLAMAATGIRTAMARLMARMTFMPV
jgi:hypothetical protein